MNGIVDPLDSGFVLAVLLFLIFFAVGLIAGLCDLTERIIQLKKEKKFYEKYNEPIGKVTDYRVISNGYKPRGHYDGPLNPPSGGTGVQSGKLKAQSHKAKGKR